MPSKDRTGNRFTGASMTRREAESIAGIMKRLRKIEAALKKREVYFPVVEKITQAERLLLEAVLESGRYSDL